MLAVAGLEPAFDVPIVNVTVVAGQTAVLPCSIEYLGKYKVERECFNIFLVYKNINITIFGKHGVRFRSAI